MDRDTHMVRLTPFEFETDGALQAKANDESHPLSPVLQTNGVLFPITPTITEQIQMNYETQEFPHSNEGYMLYNNTSNRQIALSNIVFPCDTEENARYALSVIHFFRTYSLMDFGAGSTSKPPSPMWFTAFGKMLYNKVPVVISGADFTLSDQDMDLMPFEAFDKGKHYLPAKLQIGGITLTVQHTPSYWRGTSDDAPSLEKFKNGELI